MREQSGQVGENPVPLQLCQPCCHAECRAAARWGLPKLPPPALEMVALGGGSPWEVWTPTAWSVLLWGGCWAPHTAAQHLALPFQPASWPCFAHTCANPSLCPQSPILTTTHQHQGAKTRKGVGQGGGNKIGPGSGQIQLHWLLPPTASSSPAGPHLAQASLPAASAC